MLMVGMHSVANVCPIAVVRVSGTIISEPDRDTWESGEAFTCIDDLAFVYRGIRDDDEVLGAITIIDSPGGEVLRFSNAIDAFKLLAAVKPTLAVVNEMAGSDAYRLAALHGRVWATSPVAIVGSIGALYPHVVRAGEMEKRGHAPAHVVAGEGKDAFMGDRVPTDDELAMRQRIVDLMRDEFVADVAVGRGMTPEAVLALGAHVYSAADGLENGLVDEVVPLEGIDALFAERALGLTLERAV